MDASNKKYMNKASAITLTLCSLILPFFGMTVYKTMIPISEFAHEFFYMHGHPHEVHFFQWMCVKGAVASLAIGAIIYIFIVRGCLMEKDENGKVVYINAWPKLIDSEDRIYRPLVVTVLPFIGACVTRAIGSIVELIGKAGFNVFWKFANWYQPRKPVAHKVIESWKVAYANSNAMTWDKKEVRREVTPLERVPVLDDAEDALKERGKKPSWITRFIDLVRLGRDKAFTVPFFHRLFDRSVGEFGDAPVSQRYGFNAMLRQTMSYALIVFAIGLLIALAYVMIVAI